MNHLKIECVHNSSKDYRILENLISEQRGTNEVFRVCKGENCNYALTVVDKNYVDSKKISFGELRQKYHYCYHHSISVPIIDWWLCGEKKEKMSYVKPYYKSNVYEHINSMKTLDEIVLFVEDMLHFIHKMHSSFVFARFLPGSDYAIDEKNNIIIRKNVEDCIIYENELAEVEIRLFTSPYFFLSFFLEDFSTSISPQGYFISLVQKVIQKTIIELCDRFLKENKNHTVKDCISKEKEWIHTAVLEMKNISVSPKIIEEGKKYDLYYSHALANKDTRICSKKKKEMWQIKGEPMMLSHGPKNIDGIITFPFLGMGGYGYVYPVCKEGDCKEKEYVMKLFTLDESYFDDEEDRERLEEKIKEILKIYDIVSNEKLCYRIVDWWICDSIQEEFPYVVFIMERYEKTLYSYMEGSSMNFIQKYCAVCNALLLIYKLHSMGIYHGDPSYVNFMYDKNKKLFMIDMDFAGFLDINDKKTVSRYVWDYKNFARVTPIPIIKKEEEKYGDSYMKMIAHKINKMIVEPYEKLLDSFEERKITKPEDIFSFEKEFIFSFIKDIPIPSEKYIEEFYSTK